MNELSGLQISWYALIAIMVVAYTVLDGFDLGVGIWYPLAKRETTRKAMFAAIGPFWDGNEVWLLAAGASLFAAFPPAYATVFSGFYLALMLVLFALILRAVSIEFWSHAETSAARAGWGLAFALGSSVPALLFGVALGNLLRGVPLDASGEFAGTFFTLLNPYALLLGVTNFAMLAAHGALYLAMKTTGEIADRARTWASVALWAFLPLALVAVVVTVVTQGHLLANYRALPLLWLLPLLALGLIVIAIVLSLRKQDRAAFLASVGAIGVLLVSAVAGLFPRLVPALNDAALSLNAADHSSSPLSLRIMLIVAAIGLPLVIGYTAWVYRLFSGKVDGEGSYS